MRHIFVRKPIITLFLGIVLTNIGSLYYDQEKYPESLEYYEKGVRFEEDFKQFKSAGRSYETLARIFLSLNSPDKAASYLLKALNYNQETNDIVGLTRTYSTYGRLYNYLKSYEKAIDYLKRAENYAVESDLKEYYMNTCEQLIISYQNINEYKNESKYQKKYIELYKQIYNIQDYTKMKGVEYELKNQKQINDLNEIKIRKQHSITLLLSIVFVLSGALGILFLLMYYRANRTKKLLLTSNIEIQQQKDQLLKINDQLEEARTQSESASRLKGLFLNNISHEIRTPLNGIVGLSEMIADPNIPNAEKQNYLLMVKESSTRLITTIENLVELAQLRTNQIKPNIIEIDPQKVLNDIHKTHSCRYQNEMVRFNCVVNKGLNKKIKTDEGLLKKIIIQLLDNAIKFTDNGEINMGVEEYSLGVRFYIFDTGIGISDEGKKFIFDSFRQEYEGVTRVYQGVGIGLSIVKSLADLLNLDISFESQKGYGTKFYIFFSEALCSSDN